MKPTEGVCAIIRRDKTVLMGKRSLDKKLGPGWWSPISGGIEAGETEAQAIVRECREEIGCEAQALQKVTTLRMQNGMILHFWITEITGEPSLANDENTELKWFTVAEMRSTPNVFQDDINVLIRLLKDDQLTPKLPEA